MLTTALILASCFFLDIRIAEIFARLAVSNKVWARCTSDIPDVLTEITGAIIIAGWVAYNYMTIHETHGKERQFLSFVGWTLPVAYFLKVILQDAFGRVNPRNWLFDQNLHGPMWFNRYDDYGHCFPSGHMTVFTALFAALWHFYPQGRPLYIVFLSFLGAALVVTDYHYLSDVIAGAYLGYAVVGWSYRTHRAGA